MLDNLFQWSNDWEMPFNIDKSNILHIWKKNPEFVYRWENGTLKTTKEDKDVGMHDHQQNFETKTKAAKKADQILGQFVLLIYYY